MESSSEGDLDDSPIIMARDDRLVLQRTLTRFQRQLDGLSVSVAEAQESLAAFSRRLVTPKDSDPDGDVEMVSGPGESFLQSKIESKAYRCLSFPRTFFLGP